MVVSDSNGSVGNLTTVAWRDMNGVGLDAAALEAANANISTASAIAEALLDAVNGAINLDRQSFSLNDLQTGEGLGYLGLLGRTQIQSPPGSDAPQDWSDFIRDALGDGPLPDQPFAYNDWRRIADGLQRFAAISESERSTSSQAWGGVSHANGQWFVNGVNISLGDLYTAVRVNQLYNFDVSQNGIVDDISSNNQLLEAARAWMALIRSKKPADTDSTAAITFTDRSQFMMEWEIDPDIFNENDPINYDQQQSGTRFDRWLSDMQSYVDRKDTDNQQLQIELSRKSDRRDEVLQATVSFSQKESKTGHLIAGNLG